MSLEQKRLYDELLGTDCRCGSRKKARETFCSRCYYRLPRAMRTILYRLIGNGYEETYAAAAAELDKA